MPDDHICVSSRLGVSASGLFDHFVIVPDARSQAATKVTQCACGLDGKHLKSIVMDTVIPGTPEQIHHLMFFSGFIKDFMTDNQKVLDIQFSDWQPIRPESNLSSRNISYIKPLNGSLGPKKTKCEIRDEMVYCNFDDCISTITTTKTPDVPNGSVFSVKTRTCIMWASAVSSKVTVTTEVEWIGASFIKGIIERSAIDGQKVYHNELEIAMRTFIEECQPELNVTDLTSVSNAEFVAQDGNTLPELAEHPGGKDCLYERMHRVLEFALKASTWIAQRTLLLLRIFWEGSSFTTVLWLTIAFLLWSNLYILTRMGSGESSSQTEFEIMAADKLWRMDKMITALWDKSVQHQASHYRKGFTAGYVQDCD